VGIGLPIALLARPMAGPCPEFEQRGGKKFYIE